MFSNTEDKLSTVASIIVVLVCIKLCHNVLVPIYTIIDKIHAYYEFSFLSNFLCLVAIEHYRKAEYWICRNLKLIPLKALTPLNEVGK